VTDERGRDLAVHEHPAADVVPELVAALVEEPAVVPHCQRKGEHSKPLHEDQAGESAELFEVIAALPGDVAVLFIEHDMELVFRFAQRIAVLVDGKLLTEGTPGEIAADPRVRDVYLGEAGETGGAGGDRG